MEYIILSIQGYLTSLFTQQNFILWLPWIILPAIVHELGHFLAAYIFTQEKIKFCFSWGKAGKLPIPRWVWDFPEKVNADQKRAIAQAGFVFEIAAIAFMPWMYASAE